MSSLHDFVHHELGAMPGPVPPPPAPRKKEAGPQKGHRPAGRIAPNGRADDARMNGTLKGDLFYTQDEAVPTPEGWVESDRTVDHKLISKEMFPQG